MTFYATYSVVQLGVKSIIGGRNYWLNFFHQTVKNVWSHQICQRSEAIISDSTPLYNPEGPRPTLFDVIYST